jgi:hypothetical protein
MHAMRLLACNVSLKSTMHLAKRLLDAPLEDLSALRPWPLLSRRPWAWFASWSKTRRESAKG